MAVARRSLSQRSVSAPTKLQPLSNACVHGDLLFSRCVTPHSDACSLPNPPASLSDRDESEVGTGAPRRPALTHHVCVSACSPRRVTRMMESSAVAAPLARSQRACYYRAHNYRQPLNLPRRQPDWRAGSLCCWRTFLTRGVPAAPPAAGMELQQLQQASD